METTQNKFFIIIIIDYYPHEHISQNVMTVLRDQGGVTSIEPVTDNNNNNKP